MNKDIPATSITDHFNYYIFYGEFPELQKNHTVVIWICKMLGDQCE